MIDGLLNELGDYFNVLLDIHNPIFYAIIITLVVLAIVYAFFRHIIFPLRKKHILEKKELELKQTKLMALFAELDPDPVIRVDASGVIIHTNNSAKKFGKQLNGNNISKIVPCIDIIVKKSIESNSKINFFDYINDRYYHINFRGNSYLGIAQIYFHDITDRKKYEDGLRISEGKLKKLSSHLIELIEEERHRIARELHDGIGQNLLLLKMKMNNLDSVIKKNILNGELKIIDKMFDSTIQELKNVIYDLKPKILEEMGLIPALSFLCDKISMDSNIEGKIDFVGFQNRLDDKLEIIMFRIIQESLNNVVKHSLASHFVIQLVEAKALYRIMISDDGKGFDITSAAQNKNSYGLLNIKERVENIDGTIKIESTINTGTLIIIEIPKSENLWKKKQLS